MLLKFELFHSQGMKISNSYLMLNMIIAVFNAYICEYELMMAGFLILFNNVDIDIVEI